MNFLFQPQSSLSINTAYITSYFGIVKIIEWFCLTIAFSLIASLPRFLKFNFNPSAVGARDQRLLQAATKMSQLIRSCLIKISQ